MLIWRYSLRFSWVEAERVRMLVLLLLFLLLFLVLELLPEILSP